MNLLKKALNMIGIWKRTFFGPQVNYHHPFYRFKERAKEREKERE